MAFRFYHIISALSLDVALGAGVLSLVLGRYLGFRVPVLVLLVLVITVWLIYTLDHLIDARSIQGQATSFRHHFHQHFQKTIWGFLILALVVNLFLLTQIPMVTLVHGFPVFLGVCLYFILSHSFGLGLHKEVLIALFYVLGVFIGPVSLYNGDITPDVILLLVQLGVMAWINLLVFSLFDMKEDAKDGLKSTALLWGESKTSRFVRGLLVACFALLIAGLILFHADRNFVKLQLVFLFMTGTLGVLFYRRDSWSTELNYRYFGDGVFFMPVAYFWF